MRSDILSRLYLFLILLACTTSPALVDGCSVAATCTTKQLQEASDYVRKLNSIEADFTQIDADGNKQKGRLLLSTPDKLRLEYFYPRHHLTIVNGNSSVHYDYELKEKSFLPKGGALLNLGNLIEHVEDCTADQEHIKLALGISNDVSGKKLSEIEQSVGKFNVSAEDKIALVLKINPQVALYKILILRDTNVVIDVNLHHIRYNIKLDSGNFTFADPRLHSLDDY